jgi:hypothetical protein
MAQDAAWHLRLELVGRKLQARKPHVPSSHPRDEPGDGRTSRRSCCLAIPPLPDTGIRPGCSARNLSPGSPAPARTAVAPVKSKVPRPLKLVTVSGLFRRHATCVAAGKD